MDEHIFDPVTYALLAGKVNSNDVLMGNLFEPETDVSFEGATEGKYISSSSGAINNGNNYILLRNVELKAGCTLTLTSVAYRTVAPMALETGETNLTPLNKGDDNDTLLTRRYTASQDCKLALSIDTRHEYSAKISGAIIALTSATSA